MEDLRKKDLEAVGDTETVEEADDGKVHGLVVAWRVRFRVAGSVAKAIITAVLSAFFAFMIYGSKNVVEIEEIISEYDLPWTDIFIGLFILVAAFFIASIIDICIKAINNSKPKEMVVYGSSKEDHYSKCFYVKIEKEFMSIKEEDVLSVSGEKERSVRRRLDFYTVYESNYGELVIVYKDGKRKKKIYLENVFEPEKACEKMYDLMGANYV